MRKLVILTLTLIFLLVLTSVAFGAGWHTIGPTHDPDAGLWGIPGNVPHVGLQSSSNNCKTCHAVHDGNADSFKLLEDSSRVTECDYCHDATTGVTDKKPYGDTTDPYGEHTLGLGANSIPESDVTESSIEEDGLSCGNCHSVHNAYTIFDIDGAGPLDPGDLDGKLLRRDPGNNGGDALGGIENVANYGATVPVIGPDPDDPPDEAELLASFCGDCHNKNVNWDRGTDVAGAGEGERANGNAHVIGDVDGMVNVYGQLKTISAIGMTNSCDNCHTSRTQGTSSFPHQSRGHKLFGESYRDASGVAGPSPDPWYTGDPYRPLPNTDAKVCRGCHGEVGKPDDPNSF